MKHQASFMKFSWLLLVGALALMALPACKSEKEPATQSEHPQGSEHPKSSEHPTNSEHPK